MKKKNFSKKLNLNKSVVSNLNDAQLSKVKGADAEPGGDATRDIRLCASIGCNDPIETFGDCSNNCSSHK